MHDGRDELARCQYGCDAAFIVSNRQRAESCRTGRLGVYRGKPAHPGGYNPGSSQSQGYASGLQSQGYGARTSQQGPSYSQGVPQD